MAKVKVGSASDFKPDEPAQVDVAGTPVMVLRTDDAWYAIGDTCSHEEASLSAGFYEDCIVECPKHGAMFDVATGAAKSLPATKPVPVFDITVEGDDVYVEENPR